MLILIGHNTVWDGVNTIGKRQSPGYNPHPPNRYTSYTHKMHSSHTFLPFPQCHVSSFRSSSDNWDESLTLHAWLFAMAGAVIVTQNNLNLEEQGPSLPAFPMLNFSHLLIFLVWNIGLIAAVNVGPLFYLYSCSSNGTVYASPHTTPQGLLGLRVAQHHYT